MRNIIIEELKQTPVEEQKIEIVERKGLGHPDHVCDSVGPGGRGYREPPEDLGPRKPGYYEAVFGF